MTIYDEMLGKLTLEIEGHEMEITPKKGDVRRFIKLQNKHSNNMPVLLDEITKYLTDLIAREDSVREDDPSYEKIETLVDFNLFDLMDQLMTAYKLQEERGDLKKKLSGEDFQKGLPDQTK